MPEEPLLQQSFHDYARPFANGSYHEVPRGSCDHGTDCLTDLSSKDGKHCIKYEHAVGSKSRNWEPQKVKDGADNTARAPRSSLPPRPETLRRPSKGYHVRLGKAMDKSLGARSSKPIQTWREIAARFFSWSYAKEELLDSCGPDGRFSHWAQQ